MTYNLDIWRLAGERGVHLSRTRLTCSRDDAIQIVEAMREGLPPDCAAGLTDAEGRNVLPRQTNKD